MHRIALVFVALMIGALPALPDVVVLQSGNSNPATAGFTASGGGITSQSAVTNDLGLGINAWNITGSWCCGYLYDPLSASQLADINSSSSWELTAVYRNLSTNTTATSYGPDAYGTYAGVIFSGHEFSVDLHTDGRGNQILSLDSFASGPDYTIQGLGTGYVTLQILFNNTTRTADVYVNGTDVISNYTGFTNPYASGANWVVFGGEDGNFSSVELQTVSTAPEPGVAESIGVGLGVSAMVLGRRRRGL